MAYPTPLFVFRIARTFHAFTQLLISLLGMNPIPRTVGLSFNYFLEHHLPQPGADVMCNLFLQFGGRGTVSSSRAGIMASAPLGSAIRLSSNFLHPAPGSPASAALKACTPRSRRPAPEANFHATFHAPSTVPGTCRKPYGGRYYKSWLPRYLRASIRLSYLPQRCCFSRVRHSLHGFAAGIISLLNDYLIKTAPANFHPNWAPLGFLNNWLYSYEVLSIKGLNDIVHGSNSGCGKIGFKAREGWDPVTRSRV